MHTVSLFPALLDYQVLGTFMLRATLGLLFVYSAYAHIFRKRTGRIEFFETVKLHPARIFFLITTVAELIAGTLLTLGLYTQPVAAITGMVMLLTVLLKRYRTTAITHHNFEFYILLGVVSFALLFLGPGAFAIDLPL